MARGTNDVGQLGLGDTEWHNEFTVVPGLWGVVDIDAVSNRSTVVTAEGRVYAWGGEYETNIDEDEYDTQVLEPTEITGGGIEEAGVVQVASGGEHSMALTAAGDLYTWGLGNEGQLGHGMRVNLAVPKVVDGIGGVVVGISCGYGHSLVATAGGRVLAFGRGREGQLGLGAGLEADEAWVEAVGVGAQVEVQPGYDEDWVCAHVLAVSPTNTEMQVRLTSSGAEIWIEKDTGSVRRSAQALTPTAIDGITLEAGPGRVEELSRLIDGIGSRKEEMKARHREEERQLEEDLGLYKTEKAALDKKAADAAMGGAEGKEGKE